jgi:ribosome-associated translation inhibitor RaiA
MGGPDERLTYQSSRLGTAMKRRQRIISMNVLDFTLELDGEDLENVTKDALFTEADGVLRDLADGHTDIICAAINIRHPGPAVYEATVVVYGRPNQVAATEKNPLPDVALRGALDAVERQIRQRREKLKKSWEKPGNDPVTKEIMEIAQAEDD